MKERPEVTALLAACLELIEVWDAGEETNQIEWEELLDAVNQATDAVAGYVDRA